MNILYESKIWDLHIHTNQCPTSNGEFNKVYKDDTIGFIDDLIKIFDKEENQLLNMISFTDHNQISYEVYEEYLKRKHKVKLLTGVEIDIIVSDTEPHKHIIVYFDVTELDEIKGLSIELNKILRENRETTNYIKINDLLRELLNLGHNFLISPHAFKQDKRGIDNYWATEKEVEENAKLYMDQFFCFWEAAGMSSITKGVKFLEDFEIDERISIIQFSDSNNFKELNKYLKEPPQYFHSLPSFKGLALIANEKSRIRKTSSRISTDEYSNIIGKIKFQGKTINLSNELNSIIGGRGSGKSILLDSVALKIGEDIKNTKRQEFISAFPIEIYNMNDTIIDSSFNIEYYNQAYVSDIFSSNDFSIKLKEKFHEGFNKIQEISLEKIKASNNSTFQSYINLEKPGKTINLKGLTETYPIIDDDGLSTKIYKKDKIDVNKSKAEINYEYSLNNIEDRFDKLIPSQILNNGPIQELKKTLKYIVVEESYNYNVNHIRTVTTMNQLIDNFHIIKDKKTELSRKKSEHTSDINTSLKESSLEYINRTRLVNGILKSTENFKNKYANFKEFHSNVDNRFIFSKELEIETPMQYFLRCLDNYWDDRYLKSKNLKVNEGNIENLIECFIRNPEDLMMPSKNLKDLIYTITSFDLTYKSHNNIYYVDNDKNIQDITTLSPGSQTNILMEYIVYKDTDVPLLIDQPEDNVDNYTIYQHLTKWFKDLKPKRQVIVVTHDANIVINADSENVIIANQISSNEFEYFNGALEYDCIIDYAANILDGGKVAVQRRLSKYDTGAKE